MPWPWKKPFTSHPPLAPAEVADLYDQYHFIPMLGGFTNIPSKQTSVEFDQPIAACATGIITYHLSGEAAQIPVKQTSFTITLNYNGSRNTATCWNDTVSIEFFNYAGYGFDHGLDMGCTAEEKAGYDYGDEIRHQLEMRGWVFPENRFITALAERRSS